MHRFCPRFLVILRHYRFEEVKTTPVMEENIEKFTPDMAPEVEPQAPQTDDAAVERVEKDAEEDVKFIIEGILGVIVDIESECVCINGLFASGGSQSCVAP